MKKTLRVLTVMTLCVFLGNSYSIALTIEDLKAQEYTGEQPTPEQIEQYLYNQCTRRGIPTIVAKAILLKEGQVIKGEPYTYKWQQYSTVGGKKWETIVCGVDSNDAGTIISYGLGLFQVTYKVDSNKVFSEGKDTEIKRVVKDWRYNIDKGLDILWSKWCTSMGSTGVCFDTDPCIDKKSCFTKCYDENKKCIGCSSKSLNLIDYTGIMQCKGGGAFDGYDADPSIVENWFYAIAWYNGGGLKAKEYVDEVYKIMTDPSHVKYLLRYNKNKDVIKHYNSGIYSSSPCPNEFGKYTSSSNILKWISSPYVIQGYEEQLGGKIPGTGIAYTLEQIMKALDKERRVLHAWNNSDHYWEYVHNLNEIPSPDDRNPVVFGDVIPREWWVDAAVKLKCDNVLKVSPEGWLYPEEKVDFAEFLTVMARVFGYQEKECCTFDKTFLGQEISKDSYYCPLYSEEDIMNVLEKMNNNNQVSGTRGLPTQKIQREEAAFIISELSDFSESAPSSSSFSDIETTHPFFLQIERTKSNDIFNGDSGELLPEGLVPRGILAVLAHRVTKKIEAKEIDLLW